MTVREPAPAHGMHCAECGRSFARDAIVLDEQSYCCLGCLAGGPCICDDTNDVRVAATHGDVVPLALEIGPFSSQADLMHLAMLLESRPGIAAVELVVADPRRARFVVEATSPEVVADAVATIPGYEASVSIADDTITALVATRDAMTGEEALLPPRTRFRVFHGGGEPTAGVEVGEQFHP